MSLLDRVLKAQNERSCMFCGQRESQHKAPHTFRAEPVRRFAPKDLTGYAR